MKFRGGLLIGIVIGFILFVLFTMIIALVVVPYIEEVAEEKRLAEDKEKKAQNALLEEQWCNAGGGTWIVPICGSCPENIQCDPEPCRPPYCEGFIGVCDDCGADW